MSYLEIKDISKKFHTQTVLKEINISIEKGELVCILGPSGCGKTTLLRIIGGLETASNGSIFINGRDCTNMPPAKRNFGIVFQSYALFPNMTVAQNIMFGLQGKKELSKGLRAEKVEEVLDMVDLLEHKDKYPSQLSGGQQQRTALARAVALSPDYLLLDEPLSALDSKVRVRLRSEICRIQRALKITTVMVTHDQEEALTMADKIIVMNHSIVEQIGTPQEIYEHPATPFVASFVGTMNFYRDSGEMCAVRPENIDLSYTSATSSDSMSAVIKEVEFKGALTRVYGVLSCNTQICIDMPTDKVREMDLSFNKNVFLNIPTEHLTKYTLLGSDKSVRASIAEAI